MNRDDIIRMAREAEAWSLVDHDGIAALERFADLVAAGEREACALTAESVVPRHTECGNKISAAIRARSKHD